MAEAKTVAIAASVIAVAVLVVLWQARKDAIAVAGAAADMAGDAAQAINPLNRENVFAGTVDAVGVAVSGNEGWSLGTWLYDVTHKQAATK